MIPARHYTGNWLPDLFGSFFDTDFTPASQQGNTPAINVIENEGDYTIEVAAPGMTKDDFTVKLNENGDLVIRMEKHREETEGKEAEAKEPELPGAHYLRREFSSFARFQQTLLLPEDALRENISAKVENGILTVQIPKIEKVGQENRNRAIEIS